MNKKYCCIAFSFIFLFAFFFLSSGVRAEDVNFSLTIENPTPTPTPTSVTTTTTTSSTAASTVCTASKPGSAPSLTSALPGTNSVTLTWSKAAGPVTKYLIAYGLTSEIMLYGNPNAGGPDTTSTTIRGLSGGVTYYFRVKAINDCMPGDFSGAFSASPAGIAVSAAGREVSPAGPAENFVPAAEIKNMLFDIALTIGSALLNKSGDLVATTHFTSFGTVPTLVNLVYRIEDAGGKQVYTENGEVTVETEKTVTKEFKNLSLGNGKYTLVLATTYGDNVKDEFKQAFEVKGASAAKAKPSTVILIISILLTAGAGGYSIYRLMKRKK